MNVRYTQKDIRRLLGLSRDALRLYEQRGIIQPYVDPANGYRLYDDWDVNALWEMRRYQAQGFSLGQTQRIQQDEDLTGIRGDVAARRAQLEDDLRYQSLVLDELRAHLAELDCIAGGLGSYTDEQIESFLYLPEREDHDLLLDGASSSAARLVNDNMALFRATFWFPDVTEDRYYWGFAIPARILDALGFGRYAAAADGSAATNDGAITLPDGVVALPGSPALSTYVDAGERWHFGIGLFAGLLEEAHQRGLEPTGPLYGFLLARTHDADGVLHRYAHALLPVTA